MLEKTLESPLDCKEIKPVNPKGNQSWIFTERTGAEAPILCPPDAKSWLIGKAPDAGKDWRQEEKGMTEDKMVGWHHQLNGHKFEQAPGLWWRTGKPGMLQSMKLWRVGHDWATEQQMFTELIGLIVCVGKAPDAGKDWGQEEKGMTEDKMVGWHYQLNGHEFEQTLGNGGQGSLACCSPWVCRESDMT